MEANAEVYVTLSADLLSRLREASRKEGIPFRWLVAGLLSERMEKEGAIDSMRAAS